MMSLDPKLRAVLYLHYFEGYTDEESAKMIGISTAAVKGRLRRGRDKLRKSRSRVHYDTTNVIARRRA